MQESNTDPKKEPTKEDSKKLKLYKNLKGKALYTKSFEEFSKQFGSAEGQEKLYKSLAERKLYTKDLETFKSQFFVEPKAEEAPKKQKAGSMESQSDSAQNVGGSDTAQETSTDSIQPNQVVKGSHDVQPNPNQDVQQQGAEPNVTGKMSMPNQEGQDPQQVAQEVKAMENEPNMEVADLYDKYVESGEISSNDKESIAKRVADQKKGENRSWYETAGAYVDGFLRSGMAIPLYKYDTEDNLLEAREVAQKATFLESLPNEQRESLNNYAVNRTVSLDKASQNLLAKNSMIEEKAKVAVKSIENLAFAIKKQQDSGKAVPKEMWDEYAKQKEEVDNLASAYNSNVDVIESNNEDIGSFVEELELLKKNYKGIGHYKELARLTTADMLSGVMEFGVSTAEMIPTMMGVPKSQADVSFPEAKEFISKFREETERQRSFVKPQLSIEDVEVGKNFGKWLAEQAMVQLPVLTVLAASGGGAGLGILGASAGGSKMGELNDYQTEILDKKSKVQSELDEMDKAIQQAMQEQGVTRDEEGNLVSQRIPAEGEMTVQEMQAIRDKKAKSLDALNKKRMYGKAEIYLAGLGNGMAEVLSEKISLGILSKGKRALKAASKSELKMGYKEYFQETADLLVGGTIDSAKEGSAEFGNNLMQNAIDILFLGKEDVHLFDNSLDVIASGGAMGGGMSMFPSLIGMGGKAFMGKDASTLMTTNSAKLGSLLQELEFGAKTLPESTKKLMMDKVDAIIKEQDGILTEAFKRASKRSKEDNARLLELDLEGNKILKQVTDIKSGGLPTAMQAELLQDLKTERDAVIAEKLDILNKKKEKTDGEAKVEEDDTTQEGDTTETDTTKEGDTTETDTTTTEEGGTNEGGKGQGKVSETDGGKRGVDTDGKGVQQDSDTTKGDTQTDTTDTDGTDTATRIGELQTREKEVKKRQAELTKKVNDGTMDGMTTKELVEFEKEKGKLADERASIKEELKGLNEKTRTKKAKPKVEGATKAPTKLLKAKADQKSKVGLINEKINSAEKVLAFSMRHTPLELKTARANLAKLKVAKKKAETKLEELSAQIPESQGGTMAENGVNGKGTTKGTNKAEKTDLQKEKERIAKEKQEKKEKLNKNAKNPVTELQEKKLKVKAPRVPTRVAKVFDRKGTVKTLFEVFPKDSVFYPLIELMSKNAKNFEGLTLRWNTAKESADGADGLYSRKTNEIALRPETRQVGHTITHEIVHGVTINAVTQVLGMETASGAAYIKAVEDMVALNKNSKVPIEKAVAEMGALYLEALEKTGRMDMAKLKANSNKRGVGMDVYGFTNIFEFIAEAMSNAKFQDMLNGIQSETKTTSKIPKSLFTKFVNAVSKILGAGVEGGKVIKDSLLHNVIKVSANIMPINEDITTVKDNLADLLNPKEAKSIEDFDATARDDSDIGRRERMENEVNDMLSQGMAESQIINSYDTKKEKEIAQDILGRKKNLTKEEAKAKLDSTFDKAQKEMYEKKTDTKAWSRAMRKVAVWAFDRQYAPKMILRRAGLNLVRNYMITSKGASGYAKFMYDEASAKIYQKTVKVGKDFVVDALSSAEIKLLDKMIMARRILAIDKNRAERGMPPVTNTGFISGREAKLALDQMKEDMGDKEFNDFMKRSDAYFDAFRELLDSMQESGLVSKEFRDKFFEVDYQPKVYLDFLKTAEQEMSIIEMGAEETTSLASEQVRSLEEGSAGSLITDSRYLLSRSMNARAKAVAMNNTVSRLSESMREQADVIDALKAKNPKELTAKERRQIKYFKELSKAVKYNPIVDFTKSGKPKYKFKPGKGSHPQYYYRNGVRHMVIMEEAFFDAFNDNVKGIWKNSNVKEKVVLGSLSGLVKNIATGNNPAFFITNAPRDFMFVATFSPVYGSVVPWNLVKIFGGTIKGIADIELKNNNFKNFVKHGGMLDFLHKQGEFKGTSWTRKKLSTKDGKLLGLFGNRTKNFTSMMGNGLSFKKLQMWSEIGIRMAVFNQSVTNQFKVEGVKNEAELLAKYGEDGALKMRDIYVNATAEARNTTDFSQGGIYVKDADALIPYLNAGVQGTRVAIEQLGGNGATGFFTTSLRIVQSAAMLSAVPLSMGIKMLGWLGDDEVPEDYKGLSGSERYLKARSGVSNYDLTNYSIWFTGSFNKDGEANYVRIAKPHFLTPFVAYTEGMQLNVIKKRLGDTSEDDTMERVKWALETNISPIELSVTGTLARNPLLKSALTYTTGYDFYRDQDLSYLRGDVKVATEGHESKSVEAFYKTIGLDYGISPARLKGAVESIITTPSTSPFIGGLYGGLDEVLASDEAKQAMGDEDNRVFKAITGRLLKSSSEFNRRIKFDADFDSEVSKLEIYDINNKAKFKNLTTKLMRKEISSDELADELVKVAKDSPFDAKRMGKIIQDKAKNPNVPAIVYQIKYAPPKERALYLVKVFGGDFLDAEKDMGKKNRKLWQELFTNKAINKETIYEYEKLVGKKLGE